MIKKIKLLLIALALVFINNNPQITSVEANDTLQSENMAELSELEALEAEKNELIGSIGQVLDMGPCSTDEPLDVSYALENGSYQNIDCYATNDSGYKAAYAKYNELAVSEGKIPTIKYKGAVLDTKVGVVDLYSRASATRTTNVYDSSTGGTALTYINGLYGGDAMYLGRNQNRIKISIAGVEGWIEASEANIVPYNQAKTASYYVFKDGNFYHYLAKGPTVNGYYALDNGTQPTGLASNKAYYSYDGHYFYTSYYTMSSDYRAGHRNSAVNKSNPHYNYFQFLSHRAPSNYTEDNLRNYIEDIRGFKKQPNHSDTNKLTADESKLFGTQGAFITGQTKYGTNALLSLGVALNESAHGRSNIALKKNNLFGHGAYDSAPGTSAGGYESPEASILYHAFGFVQYQYLDVLDYRYQGPHVGNKANGMNIKYASDPYWGEKAASNYWTIDKLLGGLDAHHHDIAFISTPSSVNFRKEANTSSNLIYSNGGIVNHPLYVLDVVNGSSVSGSTKWYKVASDTPLKDDRSGILNLSGVKPSESDKVHYDIERDYVYIHSSLVSETPTYHATAKAPSVPTRPTDMEVTNPDITPPPVVGDYYDAPSKLSQKTTSGQFNFHEFKDIGNGKVEFSGYLVIENQQNRPTDNIKYEIIFTDSLTKKQYATELARWTSNVPYGIPSNGNYNYSGAWFKGQIDMSKLPAGDYNLEVRAYNNTFVTTALVRNLFSRPQFQDIIHNDRQYWTRNNYYLKTVPLELFVRDKVVADKNYPTIDNMFNSYRILDLEGNSLRLRGSSFNVQGNYANSVKRQIIFENQSTYETYSYDVGSTNKGDYTLTLKVDDGKSKAHGWFDKTIDLSGLKPGTYTIYMATQAPGANDFAELNNIFASELNESSGRYQLKLNTAMRNRVELIVK